ncbi:MAG TPA: hypothetical protein DD414_11430 [Lachnospiraceae bacterium]|nr:hypothetical protein [Lachnospiraceae bacterium]
MRNREREIAMDMEDKNGSLYVGIDCQKETPGVCCQDAQMKEAQVLPLDFGECGTRAACFRKVLSALKKYGKKEKIHAVLVLPDLSAETIETYAKDACEAGFIREQLQMISASESIVHLMMHQTNDIWQQQVWLLEFGEEEVKASGFQVNKRTVPMLAEALKPEIWQIGEEGEGRDDRLCGMLKERFGKKQVSAVFLTGTDMNEQAYKKSREELCRRRRVFLGDKIYARGACVLAGNGEQKKSYLFLNEQTLLYNTGIRSFSKGEENVHTLISAGCSWHEAKGECEVLLVGDPLVEFVFWSMMGGESVYEGLKLTDLPERAGGVSRLKVEVRYVNPTECEVRVTDLGFGEMWPGAELCWEERFHVGDAEELKNSGSPDNTGNGFGT